MELNERFPSFKYCKEWPSRTCEFLADLDPQSQAILAEGLLIARHQKAATALGIEPSDQASVLMRKEEAFRLRTSPGTWENGLTPAKDKSLLATRRQLKDTLKKQFKAVFGAEGSLKDDLADRSHLELQTKCRGWILKTGFHFGRWDPEIDYSINVWTGKWITEEEPAVLPFNSLAMGLNYGNDLGIGSGWDNIAVENIEPVCASIAVHCQRMFDLAPVLLEGLDLDQLTA